MKKKTATNLAAESGLVQCTSRRHKCTNYSALFPIMHSHKRGFLASVAGCSEKRPAANRHMKFESILRRTEEVWAALPTEDERHAMQDAIWQYVIEGKTEIDIFGLNTSAVREMWDEVKENIDKEVQR